nr:hypothetical protein [Pontibacter sp. BAB1700]
MVRLKAFRIKGTATTTNCSASPSTMAPIRYLFEKTPSWKMDFVGCRMASA